MSGELHARLRHRVVLQAPVMSADGAGGFSRAWEDVAELWAEITPAQPRAWQATEPVVNQHQQSKVFLRVALRYRAGIRPDMRLMYGARILIIRAMENVDERGAEIGLLVEEGPVAG